MQDNLRLKKKEKKGGKKGAGGEWTVEHFPKILASEEKSTTSSLASAFFLPRHPHHSSFA